MPGTPNQSKSAQQIAWEQISPERQAALIAIADDYNAGRTMWRWLARAGAIGLAVLTGLAAITTIMGIHIGFSSPVNK